MIVFALAMIAGQTTTTCGWVFNQWVCNTPAPRQDRGVDWSILNQQPEPAAPVFGPGVWEAQRQWEANNRRKKAGKMMAKGDCAGARTYALTKGDPDLLNWVTSVCPG